jgi:hypothetical protein
MNIWCNYEIKHQQYGELIANISSVTGKYCFFFCNQRWLFKIILPTVFLRIWTMNAFSSVVKISDHLVKIWRRYCFARNKQNEENLHSRRCYQININGQIFTNHSRNRRPFCKSYSRRCVDATFISGVWTEKTRGLWTQSIWIAFLWRQSNTQEEKKRIEVFYFLSDFTVPDIFFSWFFVFWIPDISKKHSGKHDSLKKQKIDKKLILFILHSWIWLPE